MRKFRTLSDIPTVVGTRVLVRSELNVPIENGTVTDTYRIEKALPTIKRLSERGARVIVMAHLGRDPKGSLKPVYEKFSAMLPNTSFVDDVVGEKAKQAVEKLKDGEVLLLENLRSDVREKENDDIFSKILASYATYYVDDAFGNMHRSHASIIGVPKFIPGYAGLLVAKEVEGLSKGLSPESPSLFILGGAKFETKEALLEAALSRYEAVFIGGALANDVLQAKGYEVGMSLVSEGSQSKEIFSSEKIMLPKDVIVETPEGKTVKHIGAVAPEDNIVDIGPESVSHLSTYIENAACVLWNGPLGLYEEGYMDGTKAAANAVALSEGHSIVGGGETVAAIRELDLEGKFDFISTGGGAMLDFLVDGELPGLTALQESQ